MHVRMKAHAGNANGGALLLTGRTKNDVRGEEAGKLVVS